MYKAMIKKSKNKKGFTLVELIVVMAILAILAAILIPSVGGMITRSNKAVDNATARNLYMAGTMVAANGEALSVPVNDGSYGTFTGSAKAQQIFKDFIGETGIDLKHATSMQVDVDATTKAVTVTVNYANGPASGASYSASSGSINWN